MQGLDGKMEISELIIGDCRHINNGEIHQVEHILWEEKGPQDTTLDNIKMWVLVGGTEEHKIDWEGIIRIRGKTKERS